MEVLALWVQNYTLNCRYTTKHYLMFCTSIEHLRLIVSGSSTPVQLTQTHLQGRTVQEAWGKVTGSGCSLTSLSGTDQQLLNPLSATPAMRWHHNASSKEDDSTQFWLLQQVH